MASNRANPTTVIPSRSQNASSSASSSSTALRDGELPPRQRKHVTTACTACRRSKTKVYLHRILRSAVTLIVGQCDGNIPCANCTKLGVQHLCAAPEGLDGRRGRKRMLNEYQNKVDAVESILDFLRSSDPATIQGLIDLTRSEAPIDVIVQHAKEIIDREEIRDQPQARRQVISMAALVDKPPVQVPAKPWTNICDDDEAVSHLISVYFTWHHFSHPVVDQDIFLWHMKSADLASEFCSPFLVSSILAAACFYTDHIAAFAVAGDLSSRGVHFRDEAIRLWNLEEGKASIANLQAIPTLTASVCFSGKDRLNYLFVSQINTLSLEVVKMVKRREKQGDASATTAEFQRSYSCAMWGSFICQTDISIGWRHPFDIRLPGAPLPYNEDELLVSRRWTAYPKVNSAASVHFNGLINERISHFTIAKDIISLVLAGDPQDSPLPGHLILDKEVRLASLHDAELRLQEWYDQLPEYAAVNIESQPSALLLDLHMSYHVHQLTIQNEIVHQDEIPTDLRKDAEKKLLASCRQIIRLYDWMKQTIGFTHFGFQFVHCGVSAAYALMDFLRPNPETRGWFYTISVALCSASRRQILTRGIVKMIWITLQQRQLEPYVSEATIDLFKLSVVDNWKPEEDLLFTSCAYPNYYAMYENGREFADMGDLLAEYSSMGLEN